MNLGIESYTQGDAFQQERQKLFASSWLPIGVLGQLSEPGAFVGAAIGGWPVFAVRAANGELCAFRNTCRHRNMLVVEHATGRCAAFRCRYHGWTYGLDGRFLGAPLPVAPKDPAAAENHLVPVETQLWRELVFVNLDNSTRGGDCNALETFVAAHGGSLGTYATSIITEIGCNWKTYIELALADPGVAWEWPLVIARAALGALVLEQVTPRTFLRTRVSTHVFALDPRSRDSIVACETARAEALRGSAESWQADRANGQRADLSEPRTADLHARLLAMYSAPAPD